MRYAKVDEACEITYQPDGAKSGETVTAEIYDETGAKDPVDFPDVTMTEIGTTGRYTGSFTPDALGVWRVLYSYGIGKGPLVEQIVVQQYDVDDIADIAANPPVLG